ncbi:MAG: hypothetical protein ABEN55_11745 [Bradymonadaceae bacterium]
MDRRRRIDGDRLVGVPEKAVAETGETIETGVDDEFQVVGRFRTVGVPNFLLNAFYDQHSANWSNGQTNFGYGLEFVWRKVGAFEVSVAAEYADLSMPGNFWLESGKAARKADWVEFNLGLASLVFSGYWYWDVTQWFSPYVGGGLGLAMVLGEVTKYNPKGRCESDVNGAEPGQFGGGFESDSCFDSNGQVDKSQFEAPEIEDRLWPVAPMVSVTGGARFNIGDHGVVKLELGFYDYLFAGLSAGAQW